MLTFILRCESLTDHELGQAVTFQANLSSHFEQGRAVRLSCDSQVAELENFTGKGLGGDSFQEPGLQIMPVVGKVFNPQLLQAILGYRLANLFDKLI